MSDRVSVSLGLESTEWDTLLAPFRRVGSSDPLIAELRKTLREGEPEWVTAKTRPDLVNQDHLQSVVSALEIKIARLDALPEGEARNDALSKAQEASNLAKKLIEEIMFNPAAQSVAS